MESLTGLVPGLTRWDDLTNVEPVPTDTSGGIVFSSRLTGAGGRIFLALWRLAGLLGD
jgi:hypothetical protein